MQGVSRPSPASLEDLIFAGCCLAGVFSIGLFQEFSVAYDFRLSVPKDSSKESVDECLDLLHCHSPGSSCFSSMQQDRFYCCVEDPDFDADGQVR